MRLLILVLCLALSACDGGSPRPGTLKAVEACIKRSGSPLLNTGAVRTLCAIKNSKDLDLADLLQGRMNVYTTAATDQATVTIHNGTAWAVITKFRIRAVNTKTKDVANGSTNDLWIEPGDDAIADVTLDKPIKFREADGSWAFDWTVTNVRGVTIEAN